MDEMIVLGDEAVALGALDAGISSAYGYPGTPSTEIMEYLQDAAKTHGGRPYAVWGSNEKTSYEEALGTSFAGRRVLVTMKHVGLNVAADAFMNSALLNIKGGFVLAVADDPGMHSSQNEQDSRFYADFARIPCLEPVNQQEAYEMTREAFRLSEEWHLPVMIRLVTRLSHSRAAIQRKGAEKENPLEKAEDKQNWQLIPAWARRRWNTLLEKQALLETYSEQSDWNPFVPSSSRMGVITTGLGYNYYKENENAIRQKEGAVPSHLHIGFYPFPYGKIRKLAETVDQIVVLEEGYPVLEKLLAGILPTPIQVKGKLTGDVPLSGELDPDNVRPALGLPEQQGVSLPGDFQLPGRPPQLCKGCPHEDSYNFIKEVRDSVSASLVTADIGCYALGTLPPYSVPETIVCMGASITVAKGAAEAGQPNTIAVIGDSTFYHSGLTGLVDCVSCRTPVTVVILDNNTVGMTGNQETILPSSRLEGVVRGLGVETEHLHIVNAHRKDHGANTALLKKEMAYQGVSVIIAVRPCLEQLRKEKSRKGASS